MGDNNPYEPEGHSSAPQGRRLWSALTFPIRRAFRVTGILYLVVLFNCRAGWLL